MGAWCAIWWEITWALGDAVLGWPVPVKRGTDGHTWRKYQDVPASLLGQDRRDWHPDGDPGTGAVPWLLVLQKTKRIWEPEGW